MARTLGEPFHDTVTAEDVGVNKPDPQMFAYCRGRQSVHGYGLTDFLHVAQSQYDDIGVAKRLGFTTCWIERRRGQEGFGATPVPDKVTEPDYHYATLAELADAVEAEA
jgi:putative hydrolase of the HAD superfamily